MLARVLLMSVMADMTSGGGVDRAIDEAVILRRKTRKISVSVVVAAVVVALFLYLPGWIRPGVDRAQIRTGRVARKSLESAVSAAGTVVPAFEMALSSPVEARVERILKHSGDVVRAGDEIFALDTSASRLDVGRMEQRLALKLNEKDRLRLTLEETSRDLAGKAESGRLDLQILRYRESQMRSLHEAGLASEQALREAEVAASKATIELDRIEASSLHARRATDVSLAGLSLEIDTLRKELDEARRQLLLATTRADRDGVLTWTIPQEGVTVKRGDVIARIADLSAFRVEASVSDIHADRLRVGQPARVVLDERRLGGRVSMINPAVENGTLRFFVELDEPGAAGLRQNLRVDVLALTETKAAVLTIARGPFAQGGALQQVFVIRGQEAVRTQARFGLTGWDAYEVLEGLSEGDEVILSDMRDFLHAGKIRVR